MELDVTSPFETIKAFAAEAERVYGRIDVLVNGTGYPAAGPLEELGYVHINRFSHIGLTFWLTGIFLAIKQTRRHKHTIRRQCIWCHQSHECLPIPDADSEGRHHCDDRLQVRLAYAGGMSFHVEYSPSYTDCRVALDDGCLQCVEGRVAW